MSRRMVDPKIVIEVIKRVPRSAFWPITIGIGIAIVIYVQQYAAWKFEKKLEAQRTADRIEQQAQRQRDRADADAALSNAVETVLARGDAITSNRVAVGQVQILEFLRRKGIK